MKDIRCPINDLMDKNKEVLYVLLKILGYTKHIK